jgi:hypothetical protein
MIHLNIVGAVFFVFLAQQHLKHVSDYSEQTKAMFSVVCFIVLSSIIVHGITVPITHFHLKRRMKRKMKKAQKIGTMFIDASTTELIVSNPQINLGSLQEKLDNQDSEADDEHEESDEYVTDIECFDENRRCEMTMVTPLESVVAHPQSPVKEFMDELNGIDKKLEKLDA